MTGISFTGIGSGLEVSSIVEAIVGSEQVPYETRVINTQGAYSADISAIGTLKSALEEVVSALQGLGDVDEYQQTTISGKDDFVSLSSDKEAEVGNYSIQVDALATAHKLMASPIDADEEVGEGTLTIASGDDIFDVAISGSSTLSDIRDAINKSNDNSSVTATIITDDLGQRLVLSSKKTGLDNGITVNVSEGDNKLTSTAVGMTETDTVGSGTLSFESAGNDFDIAIAATDSLSDIVTAINDSADNTSVVASIVNDADGAHLVFNSIEPGVSNAITVTAADDDGANGDVSGISQFVSANMSVPVVDNTDMTGLSRLTSDSTNKLTSVNSFSSNDTVGSGTLSFGSNGNNFDVTVDATDNLDDIMNAINDNVDNTSVKASIVLDDAGGEHLMFSSKLSGDIHAITVTAIDDDGDNSDMNGISQFNSTNQNATANLGYMFEVDTPTDAQITIDGTVVVTNSSNVFDSVIDGITVTANKVHDIADGDDLSKITVTADNGNVASGLSNFIEKFNALVDVSNQLGQSTEEGVGVLAGDSLLRSVMSKLRSQFNEAHSAGDESFTLSQLGVRTELSGYLSLDTETLNGYIEENPDAVQEFFIGDDDNLGFAETLTDFVGFYTDSGGLLDTRIDGKTTQIDKLDLELEAFSEKMASLEARLYAQYNAMDLLVAQLSSTGSYLSAQLENMPGVVSSS
jgi:flagellar hook-associated protein 2